MPCSIRLTDGTAGSASSSTRAQRPGTPPARSWQHCWQPPATGQPSLGGRRRASAGRARETRCHAGRRLRLELIFTSSATDADNRAVLAALAAPPADAELVVSATEHPAVLEVPR